MNTRVEIQQKWLRPLSLTVAFILFFLSFFFLSRLTAPAWADPLIPGEPPTGPEPASDPIASVNVELPAMTVSLARVAAAGQTRLLYLPFIQAAQTGLVVNPENRGESAAFFKVHYAAFDGEMENSVHGQTSAPDATSGDSSQEWRGDPANCNEGEPSPEFRDAILHRINYFRAMAGIPANVHFSDEFNRKAQKAALMISVNRRLSHSPGPDWACYSSDGAQAARSSNLFLGVYAWDAISGYMTDPGDGNSFVGHRRWILYPQTQYMGTGDIPNTSGYPAANVLWVFDDNVWAPRPATRTEFVAWPPAGYTPYQVVFPKWSFSYPNADFSGASVAMTRADGRGVALTVYTPINGFGENTLVWRPDIPLERPASDTQYTIRIDNVIIDGVARAFVYDVTIFDPDA